RLDGAAPLVSLPRSMAGRRAIRSDTRRARERRAGLRGCRRGASRSGTGRAPAHAARTRAALAFPLSEVIDFVMRLGFRASVLPATGRQRPARSMLEKSGPRGVRFTLLVLSTS